MDGDETQHCGIVDNGACLIFDTSRKVFLCICLSTVGEQKLRSEQTMPFSSVLCLHTVEFLPIVMSFSYFFQTVCNQILSVNNFVGPIFDVLCV